VRSYARYLEMDPDKAFASFCEESGFSVAHGMSEAASVVKKPSREERLSGPNRDPFSAPSMPFVPAGEAMWTRIEPGAVGSMLVLVGLISAIGFGGWSVLKEVQRVQYAPVDQTPVVLSDLDPLNATIDQTAPANVVSSTSDVIVPPSPEAFDRLYRPQALDVPVLVARDAPISTLDPNASGVFTSPQAVSDPVVLTADAGNPANAVPQVVETPTPGLRVVAVRPSWVRVRAADGTVIFESIMEKGDTYEVATTEEPPTLRVGESGAIYFEMNGSHYGPAGESGSVTANVSLSIAALSETYAIADLEQDSDLAQMVAELQTPVVVQD